MRKKEDYVFFWTTKHVNGWASQWYPAPFTAPLEIEPGNGPQTHTFPSTEHWMMANKALLFSDPSIARTVLRVTGSSAGEMRHVKSLGRKVKHFDDEVWVRERERIVLEGNLHKFRQNEELRVKLLDTGDRVIVEASPRDKIWGIGMGENTALTNATKQWGLNLLGKALMETRRILREEVHSEPGKDGQEEGQSIMEGQKESVTSNTDALANVGDKRTRETDDTDTEEQTQQPAQVSDSEKETRAESRRSAKKRHRS